MAGTQSSTQEKPLIHIGWIVAAEEGQILERNTREALEILSRRWRSQLPEFEWRLEVVVERLPVEQFAADPLDLLGVGVEQKIERQWDFAFVVTGRKLRMRRGSAEFGAPSSALETAVVTFSERITPEIRAAYLAVAGQNLLGNLLGLEAGPASGVMKREADDDSTTLPTFSDAELAVVRNRLREVGDLRLEEQRPHWNRGWFYLRTFFADSRGIAMDVWGYRPWSQPFRLRKLTAAAFVSTLLLFLGAEAWELGVGSSPVQLAFGALIANLAGTIFHYRGQNLSELTHRSILSEQLARSRIVLLFCLTTGIISLWILLLVVSFAVISSLPREVIERWLEEPLDFAARFRLASFAATLGSLAGAFGGNLEAEGDFKAEFFIDEET